MGTSVGCSCASDPGAGFTSVKGRGGNVFGSVGFVGPVATDAGGSGTVTVGEGCESDGDSDTVFGRPGNELAG